MHDHGRCKMLPRTIIPWVFTPRNCSICLWSFLFCVTLFIKLKCNINYNVHSHKGWKTLTISLSVLGLYIWFLWKETLSLLHEKPWVYYMNLLQNTQVDSKLHWEMRRKKDLNSLFFPIIVAKLFTMAWWMSRVCFCFFVFLGGVYCGIGIVGISQTIVPSPATLIPEWL